MLQILAMEFLLYETVDDLRAEMKLRNYLRHFWFSQSHRFSLFVPGKKVEWFNAAFNYLQRILKHSTRENVKIQKKIFENCRIWFNISLTPSVLPSSWLTARDSSGTLIRNWLIYLKRITSWWDILILVGDSFSVHVA